MEYIKPKPKLVGTRVDWKITRQVKELLKHYTAYSSYTEEEIVNTFLLKLRDDQEFKAWLDKQRNNKRALQQIYSGDE